MALGVVKQICTPSSAARPPVNHPKGSLPLLSTRFLTSPPSISSLFFLFFVYIFLLLSNHFFFLFNDRLCTIILRTKVFSSKRNGIWGRLRFVHAREPAKIEGGHAFFTRKPRHRSIRHERRRRPHARNTCHYVDSFEKTSNRLF